MNSTKWEMCVFGIENIVFYSPQNGTSVFPINDFMNKFVDKGKKSTLTAPSSIVIPWILDKGWEPYANISGTYYFRRKLE